MDYEQFEDEPDEDAIYASYKQLNVQEVTRQINAKAKAYIKGVADLYMNGSDLLPTEFKELHFDLETTSLALMLKQVVYAGHTLDTLMEQLDSGGYRNAETYKMINDQQKLAAELTLQVAKYKATLPQLFRALQEDVKEWHSIEAEVVEDNQEALPESSGTVVRDTKSFLEGLQRKVMDARSKLDEDMEQIDNRDTEQRSDAVEVEEDESFGGFSELSDTDMEDY